MERKPNGYWNIKENVFAEAKKYQTRGEFAKGCSKAYHVAWNNGWLSEMIWFEEVHKPNGYWTKENVFVEARKYQTKSEFKKGCVSAYIVARKNGWLSEMTWLVDGRLKLHTDKIDCVYKYYFKETNSVYVGRTNDKVRRDKQHLYDNTDAVYIHAKENGFAVPPMEIIEDNLTLEEGVKKECYWVEYYREKGYNILNRRKAGGIGAIGCGKWDKCSVFAESRKYNTRTEFAKGCSSAYTVARKNGWLSEMTWLVEGKKPNGYWTKDSVFTESRKYNTKSEFEKGCSSAYNVAFKNGWLSEMTWLVSPQKPSGYWNIKENVFAEARKYKCRWRFSKKSSRAYNVARKNGWLSEMLWFQNGRKLRYAA